MSASNVNQEDVGEKMEASNDLDSVIQLGDYSINYDQLSGRDLLGIGAYGKVFKCLDGRSGIEVAVKEVELGLVENSKYKEEIDKAIQEVEIMRRLNHKNILECYGREYRNGFHGPETKLLCIYMAYMPGGSVRKRLDRDGAFSENKCKEYTYQILEGLAYLHRQHIMHRDLKGSNILFDKEDSIKLADFGVSKYDVFSTYASRRSHSTGICGTAHWMAPEVIAGEKYGRKADIWSVGATLVEMFTKQPPWCQLKDFQMMFRIGNKERPQYHLEHSVNSDARNFLDIIFNYNYDRRPSAEELLKHCWFLTESGGHGQLARQMTTEEYDDLSDLSDEDECLLPSGDLTDEKVLIRRSVKPTINNKIKQLRQTRRVFNMTQTRGRALIINNVNFDGTALARRDGSDVDVMNMEAMLQEFKFEVEIKSNLTATGILEAVESEVRYDGHENFGCHVLVIMSHGSKDNYIYGTDLRKVSLIDVYDLLTPLNFRGMTGKPKVVIIQACSGDRTGGISSDASMNPDVKPPQADDVVHLPASSSTHSHHKLVYDDLLVVKASVESFVSWRHPVYGSLMIRALVSSMYKHAGHHDLCAIFKQVQAKVRNLCVKRNFGHGQLVIAWDTLTNMRKLYLFPGL